MAAVDIESVEPFCHMRKEVGAFYDSYVDNISVHFDWLDEVLDEAKQAFQKPEMELLPKTPSEKRKHGRAKRGSVQKRESSAKKRQSSRRFSRKSTAYLKVEAAIHNHLAGDAEAESDTQAVSGDETDNLENIIIPVPVFPVAIVEEPEDVVSEEDAVSKEDAVCKKDAVSKEDQVVQVRDVREHDEGTDHRDALDVIAKEVESSEVMNDEVNEVLVVETSQPTATKEMPVKEEQEEQRNIQKTPEPSASRGPISTGPPKSYLPIPVSGTKDKFSTPSGLTPRMTPTHPISRCRTPQKSAAKPSTEEVRERFNQQMAGAAAKRDELLKQKIEEQKRKREERLFKVAQQRVLQKAKEEEMKRKIEEKYNTPVVADMEEKRKLRPRYPDSSAKKTDNERGVMLEREKIKEKERIIREQEEMQRLKQVEQERHQQKAPPVAQAPPKQVEPKPDADHQPSTQPKNVATFHQPQDTSLAKVVIGKPKSSRETYVVGNSTVASANTSGTGESYDMTPLRKVKPATATNYDISDLRSSDETDDDEHPRKKIPSWAQGGQLKMALTQQYYSPPDLDELFGVVIMPDLAQMFTFQRKRFFKRTSSAKWDSPIHPHAQR